LGMERPRDGVVASLRSREQGRLPSLDRKTGDENRLFQLAEPRDELADLLRRLALAEDHLRDSLPDGAFAVELREFRDPLHGKLRERAQRFVDVELASLQAGEEIPEAHQIHPDRLPRTSGRRPPRAAARATLPRVRR